MPVLLIFRLLTSSYVPKGGTGSWRTRHLKIRCSYIPDQVAANKLKAEHIEGVRQLADLATKMHPKTRLQQLLCLWCFEGVPLELDERIQVRKLYLLCVLLALQARSVAAVEMTAASTSSRQSSLQLTGFDELLLTGDSVGVYFRNRCLGRLESTVQVVFWP